ncbi:hypothetical protein L9F63_014100, partial [Diploptera punctata]
GYFVFSITSRFYIHYMSVFHKTKLGNLCSISSNQPQSIMGTAFNKQLAISSLLKQLIQADIYSFPLL